MKINRIMLFLTGFLAACTPTPTSMPLVTVAPTDTASPTPSPSTTTATRELTLMPSASLTPLLPTPRPTPLPPTPTLAPASAVERILFASGATEVTVQGYLPVNEAKVYVTHAAAGQFVRMNAAVGTMGQGLRFSIVGADGTIVKPMGKGHVRTVVPSTQDYYVELVSDVGAVNYRLSVLIPARVRFAPGAASAVVEGNLGAGAMRHYVIHALAGQRMVVDPHITRGQVGLVISGTDGQVLLGGHVGRPGGVYDGTLPTTQDYLIAVRARGETGADYALEITIDATPEQEPQHIHFEADGTAKTVTGTLPEEYIVPMSAGQTLSVDVVAPRPTTLWVSGENRAILAGETMDETTHWEGRVPSTQDYLLELGLIGPGTVFDYTMTVSYEGKRSDSVTISGLVDPTPATRIYRSTEYGFEVEYPSDFGQGTCPVAAGIIDDDSEVLFLRLLGDSYHAGTNLLDACVVMTVDGSEAARSTCQKPKDSESPEEHLGPERIDGIEFSTFSRGGATTWHTHELTGYRALQNEACYEVILFLYYRNLGTYAPGAVSKFDGDAVMYRLNQVLYSVTMFPPEEEMRGSDKED